MLSKLEVRHAIIRYNTVGSIGIWRGAKEILKISSLNLFVYQDWKEQKQKKKKRKCQESKRFLTTAKAQCFVSEIQRHVLSGASKILYVVWQRFISGIYYEKHMERIITLTQLTSCMLHANRVMQMLIWHMKETSWQASSLLLLV